jgi:hypothetical protein
MARFVSWYNGEHRHSAIRYLTPDERHRSIPFDVIGGARLSAELDAARAIEEGTRVGQALRLRESEPSETMTG